MTYFYSAAHTGSIWIQYSSTS